MTIEFFIAGGVCILFLLLALLFAALGEKGAMLVSGFNTMSKSKQNMIKPESVKTREIFSFSGVDFKAAGILMVWLISEAMIYVIVVIQVVLFLGSSLG